MGIIKKKGCGRGFPPAGSGSIRFKDPVAFRNSVFDLILNRHVPIASNSWA